MNRNPKATVAVSLVAAAATLLAACSSSSKSKSTGGGKAATGAAASYNAAFDKVVNPSTKTGGTLKLISTSDCDSWDPGRTYYGWCWNMQRLLSRSLMGYETLNGTKFKIAPDLATAAGKPAANFTQWTYTLKSGLKFSNGAPITPMDVKYGVERLFATDVINGGPSSYFINTIKHPSSYLGPYKSGDLSSITTTSTTITFNLKSPYADFNYLMAMAASAPVPNKTEGGAGFVGANYTKHPVASGPFMIKSYTPQKEIVFARNPDWSQSTDTIHHPLVDGVDMVIDSDSADADNKLKAGTVDANASAAVTAALQTQILTQPSLKKNADDPPSAFVQYLAVMPSVIPDVNCRRAIFYASNKAALLQGYGGAVSGAVSGSMTPPGIIGNDPSLNPYPVGADNTGDLTKAKAALVACGKPNGFKVKMAYATPSQHALAAFKAELTALGRVGITVEPATADASSYYSTFIGSPANIKNQRLGIAVAGWGADFPTGYGFWNSISNGANILPTGNSNYPSLNDPTVNKVLTKAPGGATTEADWKTLDEAVMTAAVYMPMYWGKNLYYRNPRMTNVTSDNALAFGIYDFVNVGVSG